jgi:hypothetical protein
MADQKQLWRLVLPVALLAFVLGTTFGRVWHHHANSSPETCPICHLSHQAIEAQSAGVRVITLVPKGPGPEPLRRSFTTIPAIQRIPARAPPA